MKDVIKPILHPSSCAGRAWLAAILVGMCFLSELGLALAAPSTPQLLEPGNHATNVPLVPTLEINCNTLETAAAQYIIAADAQLTTLVYDSLENPNDVCQHFAFAPLAPNTQYYWQARIKNAQGDWSAWSSPGSFTTGSQTPFFNVFQDGTAGYAGTRDADIRGDAQNPLLAIREWDQGAQDVLRTGRRRPGAASDEIYRSLLKFDLGGLTDANAVQNVYLEMTGYQHGQIAEWFPGHHRLNALYEVLRPWTEGDDIKDVDSETGEVSWSYSERPTQWAIPGVAGASDFDPNTDRKATPLSQFVTTNEVGYRTYWSSKQLLDTVKNWIANPGMNQGLFFQATDESEQKTVMLASREHADPTFHPRLVVVSSEQAAIGLNHPPVAGRDAATLEQGTSISLPVLSNDIDHDESPTPLFIESVEVPAHGAATIIGDTILYVPTPAYVGVDRFQYTVSDGEDRAVGVVIVAITAAPLPETLPVTVTSTGTGTGTVSSVPGGLACPPTCTAEFFENTQVVLTAAADPNAAFTGWTGAGCSGTGPCVLTMTQAEVVTAEFSLLPPDTEAPAVSLLTPIEGQTVTGGVSLLASASDNVGVVGVQFFVDGTPLGTEVPNAPWATVWNSTLVPPGLHTLGAQARDAAGNTSLATEVTVIVAPPIGFFQDNGPDGLVVIEAESFHQNTPQGSHSWAGVNPPEASNGTALAATPNSNANNNGNYAVTSPRVDYTVQFTQAGTHYIWVRGLGATTSDDSLHVGLNGQEIGSSDRLSGFAPTWTWSNQTMDGAVAAFTVPTPGEHTLNVWMREDGTLFDKILLTTNPTYPTPTGHGPAESPQGTPPPPETEPPVVTLLNLSEGQVLTGSVTLQATATDNVGVVGVQFLLNASPLGPEVTNAPWELSWDTTTTAPGTYVVSAQARDAAGNTGNAPAITVVVTTPPPPVTYPLTLSMNGLGSGTVTSVPTGVNCPTLCSLDWLENEVVTLTALPNADSIFAGWTGAGCSGTGPCILTMTQAHTVTATFSLLPPDTEAPTVALTSPTDGQTVTGILPVSATASDNVAVVGVQFMLNGGSLGLELTSAPWTMAWDSSTVIPGVYTLSAQARDAAGNLSQAPDITILVDPTPLPTGFLQENGPDGLVVIEAENFHQNTAKGNHSWSTKNVVDTSNGLALEATPNSNANNNGNYAVTSPRVDYTVQFTQAGTHFIWVRGLGPTTSDDSLHIGLNGQEIATSDRLSGFAPTWTWSNQTMDGAVAAFTVPTPGEHTLNVWMREDGVLFDKILLTTNPTYPTPTGHGPAESPQGPPPPDETAPDVTITSPVNGATVSGTITLMADAYDNSGSVATVQFFLEGSPLGPELTTPPFLLEWDTTTVSPDLSYALSAEAWDHAGNNGTTVSPTIVQVIVPGAMRQQDSGMDGLISLEAEHFEANVSQGIHTWIVSTQSGYSGDSAMVTDPNINTNQNSNYSGSSPRLDFQVNFTHVGTHYVWIRGIGLSNTDDSVHVGLDGQELSSSDKISGFSPDWTWSNQTMDGPVATVQVTSTGPHTINLWMREDGTIIDKIVLTVNSSYTPTILGPPESPIQ